MQCQSRWQGHELKTTQKQYGTDGTDSYGSTKSARISVAVVAQALLTPGYSVRHQKALFTFALRNAGVVITRLNARQPAAARARHSGVAASASRLSMSLTRDRYSSSRSYACFLSDATSACRAPLSVCRALASASAVALPRGVGARCVAIDGFQIQTHTLRNSKSTSGQIVT